MSIDFVLVMLCSAGLFKEPVMPFKFARIALVMLGLVVGSQG